MPDRKTVRLTQREWGKLHAAVKLGDPFEVKRDGMIIRLEFPEPDYPEPSKDVAAAGLVL